MLNPCRGRER